LGLSIDPTNSLYQAGGMPSFAVPLEAAASPSKDGGFGVGATLGAGAAAIAGVAAASVATAGNVAASSAANSFGAATAPLTPTTSAAGSGDLSFDLDLDFSLDEENANVIKDLASTERTSRMAPLSGGSMASGFGTLDVSIDPPSTTAPQPLAPVKDSVGGSGLEFELPAFVSKAKPGLPAGEMEDFKKEAAVSFGTTVSGPLASFAPKVAAAPAPDNGGMLEFDLGSLSLDLNDSTEGSSLAQSAVAIQDDPLATKLSLAEEFNTIGDEDGARALIEEVIAEASGEMKSRAQAALAKLS
jgi:pilus assembly protein FimV